MKTSNNKEITDVTLEEIIEQLPGHIYWKGKDGKSYGCNIKSLQDLGIASLSNYIGKTDYDFFPKKQADKITKVDREVMRTGKTVVAEELSDLHDGSTALFLSHKAPLRNKAGKIVGLAGVSLDITQAKQKEIKRLHLLENIIALMPGHVYWKDKHGKYLGCNNAQAKSLGLRSKEDILKKKPYENLSKEEASLLIKGDTSVLKDGKTITVEEAGIRENGTVGVFLTKKTPLYNRNEEIIGLLGISFDITERKEAEQMLKIAKKEAEKSNKIKSDFISNMEHDIRTPFVGIYGMVDILAKKETDVEKKAILHDVSICAKELMNYCDGILDFSRIESEGFPVVAKSFSLRKVADRIIKIESIAAKHKKLDLSLEYDEKLPKVVIGDPYRLERILINLASNAIKFTKKGFVKLSVSLEKEDKENRKLVVKFTIEDSGIGISDDKKALIYERFTKVTPSNKGLYKGLGLGLRIVKQFIDELNGDIHLKSEVEKGSTFVVFLPFKIPLSDEIIDEE